MSLYCIYSHCNTAWFANVQEAILSIQLLSRLQVVAAVAQLYGAHVTFQLLSSAAETCSPTIHSTRKVMAIRNFVCFISKQRI